MIKTLSAGAEAAVWIMIIQLHNLAVVPHRWFVFDIWASQAMVIYLWVSASLACLLFVLRFLAEVLKGLAE